MIEKRIIDYLSETLELPVYAEMPEPNSGEFLVVEKTGSSRENYVDTANFVVQSYADSLEAAAELNIRVINAMLDMGPEHNISEVRKNTDYNNTDTSTKRYRYEAVFVVTYY